MWKKGREEYDNIPIPEQLSFMVENVLQQQETEIRKDRKRKGHYQMIKRVKYITAVAAAVSIAFFTGVWFNEEFAMATSEIPLIGNLVTLITSQEYTKEDEKAKLSVTIPKIEGKIKGNLEEVVNQEIRKRVNEITKEARERAEEYREAYVQTGGDEQDWKMDIQINYDIKCQNEEYLSFKIWKTESLASCYTENYYYNIDLEVGKELTLRDLLGPDYKEIANKAVKEGIEKRLKEDKEAMFFGYGEDDGLVDGFESIADDQNFFINEEGNVVLVFEKYSIAPGYMGEVEFELENNLCP